MKEQTTLLHRRLILLVTRLNESGYSSIKLHQQNKRKENMSLEGGIGRLYVQPSANGYDVSLSGASIEHLMTKQLEELFGRIPDGYKQTNATKGFKKQPYWRTDNFSHVEVVSEMYARLGRH
ncbi:hypothetical protein BCT86_13035 [Vibrio breoganii]|uniref:hypothetical protein n=1 Tax=Vibrio breoganii TaxID=553239 RepID=UPI000C85D266|nr:hypothetical protein [Vibrio breoganii]PML05254.1 hypothetical protein BCT86_13035 [Vibrio breoganii]